MIKCNKISKYITYNNQRIEIIKDISAEFSKGKINVIVGNSGSGKSTFLNILGLLDDSSAGDYYYEEININSLSSKEKLRFRAENIGIVNQQNNLLVNLTVKENVKMPLYLNTLIPKNSRNRVAEEIIKRVGLENRTEHLCKTLSGGEQQRIAIARAIINNPNIILADEPTGSIDSKNQEIVLDIFRELANEGKTIIIVTHSDIVEKFADKVYRLKNGVLEEVNENK